MNSCGQQMILSHEHGPSWMDGCSTRILQVDNKMKV